MARTLQDWEAFLTPHFEQVRFLGEIPVTRQDCNEIGRLLHEQICLHGSGKATTTFFRKYPCTFAVYMVAMGVHYYDSGDYWTAVMSASGVNYNEKNRWGPAFLQTLEDFELELFENIKGHKFVSRILAHGGIPVNSLPDYFRNALMPSVQRPQYRDLSAEEVKHVILNRSVVQLFTDKPVKRFLERGGTRATQFLDETRKMARYYLAHHDLPAPAEVKLPAYVLRAFQNFVEEDLAESSDKRYRRPRVVLSPSEPDFYISLPSEPVDAKRVSAGEFYWRVEDAADGQALFPDERVRVRRRGNEYLTEETSQLLGPVSVLQISFMWQPDEGEGEIEPQVVRAWHLRLAPEADEVPLLVFDEVTGRMLSWNQIIPGKVLHLVFPKDIHIQLNGKGEAQETYPSFWGKWSDWQVETWDLRDAFALQLMRADEQIAPPIPIQLALLDPHLEGGQQLGGVWDPDEIPFYVDGAPYLRLPRRPGISPEKDAEGWMIHYRTPNPVCSSLLKNEHYLSSNVVQFEETYMLYPLEHDLGASPCGTFYLTVTDPEEKQTELAFRVWPQLTVKDLPAYVLPGKTGAEEIRISITLQPGAVLQVQDGAEGISIQSNDEDSHVSLVRIAPQVSLAELILSFPRENDETVWVPLCLAIPRLQWMLKLQESDEKKGENREWRSVPPRLAVDSLLQSEYPAIHLTFPNADELPLRFILCLVNAEDSNELQYDEGKRFDKLRQMHLRFGLSKFKDTLREHSDLSVMGLRLYAQDWQENTESRIDLAWVTRDLNISDIQVEPIDELSFRILWSEPVALRNRRVHIWSVWQPWSNPIEVKIPNEAREEYVCHEVGLPTGEYRLAFSVAATWDTQSAPSFPPDDSFHISLGVPRERLDRIEERIQTQPKRTFMLNFEKACIWTQLEGKDSQEANKAVQWCYRHFEQASIEHMLAFHDWLGTVNEFSQRAARMQMYKPEIVEHVLASSRDEAQKQRYLSMFNEMKLANLESIWLVMKSTKDPGLKFFCLHLLLKRENEEVVADIVQNIQEGSLSREDAVDLCEGKGIFVFENLRALPATRAKEILLDAILTKIDALEGLVQVNDWVRSDAGWGRIDRIWDEEWNFERQCFLPVDHHPILYVTLRGDDAPESVEINLLEETIDFRGIEKVYVCIQDGGEHFMSSNLEYVIVNHGQVTHHKKVEKWKEISLPHKIKHELCYRLDKPKYDAIWE